jgi:hypothetical protein
MKADKLKWHRYKNREAMCRGSLAWLGRQTHNLEFVRGKRPTTRSRGLESRPRHHFKYPFFKESVGALVIHFPTFDYFFRIVGVSGDLFIHNKPR